MTFECTVTNTYCGIYLKGKYSRTMLNSALLEEQFFSLSMATLENLPLELIDNPIAEEPSIFKYLNETDILNCSVALAGTRCEQYVTQKFLRPQLNIFASLDLNLKESLKNEGWSEECKNTNLIVRLWKEFQPSLPGKIILNLTC